MNSTRFYLVDITNPDAISQREVARSMPNDLTATVEYEIPVEYEISKVKVVVGYGNTDTYLYAHCLVSAEHAGEVDVH